MSSEYRDEVRKVSKEAPFTALTVLKWGILAIAVIALLVFFAQALGIISMDILRERTQHSQQYTETKVSLLHKLHNDWLTLNAEVAELRTAEGNEEVVAAKQAQQKSIVRRMREEADRIPDSQVPSSIRSFLSIHSR